LAKITDARAWLNENPLVVGGIAALVLVIAVTFTTCSLTGGGGTAPDQKVWLYDEPTGQLQATTYAAWQLGGADAAGNPVRGFRFGCGGCGPDNDVRVDYLERYTEEGRAALRELAENPTDAAELERLAEASRAAHQRKAVGAADWQPANEPAGIALLERPAQRCGDREVVPCPPE